LSDDGFEIKSQSCSFEPGMRYQPKTSEEFRSLCEELIEFATAFTEKHGVDLVFAAAATSHAVGDVFGMAVIRAHPPMLPYLMRRLWSATKKLEDISDIDVGARN